MKQDKTKATRSSKAQTTNKRSTKAIGSGEDSAVALLKEDHRKVEKLFKQYEDAGEDSQKKSELARRICQELIIHAHLEEEIFYPACKEMGVENDSLDEAQVEHDGAKVMIGDILNGSPDEPFFDAKVCVLTEYIKHHVLEEEKPRSGIFAQAKKAGLDMNEVGKRLQARKTELTVQAEALAGEPLQAKSLQLSNLQSANEEMQTMPRNSNRDRDDTGRFTSDDNDNRSYSRNQSSRGQYSQSRDGYSRSRSDYDDERQYRGGNQGGSRERDEQGRFMSDDDEGDYRSSRGGYRGGNQERDEQGRFMSDYDEDDGRNYNSRGGGRVQSQSNRGSQSRSSSSRGGQGQGHGGWFGDPRGHSQAAKRGWQHRE